MTTLEHSHSKKDIAKRLGTPPKQSYLRDWIYGGIDGAVTTFAVISGVVGGQLSTIVILILGFANLFADGFSMAASNFLGTRAEEDQYRRYKEIEEKHIRVEPEGEKNEINYIYRRFGLKKADADEITKIITSNKSLWIQTMLQEEYGMPLSVRSAYKSSLFTFMAFVIFGMIPLMPYLLKLPDTFMWSCIATGLTFFIIGSIKGMWSPKPWYYSGVETLCVGAVTATLAWSTGVFLNWMLG